MLHWLTAIAFQSNKCAYTCSEMYEKAVLIIKLPKSPRKQFFLQRVKTSQYFFLDFLAQLPKTELLKGWKQHIVSIVSFSCAY